MATAVPAKAARRTGAIIISMFGIWIVTSGEFTVAGLLELVGNKSAERLQTQVAM